MCLHLVKIVDFNILSYYINWEHWSIELTVNVLSVFELKVVVVCVSTG